MPNEENKNEDPNIHPVTGVSRIVDKRQMDTILLNKETKMLKEKLLDMIDALVCRQNLISPGANFEQFLVETSSRKVLKELLGNFNDTAEDLRKQVLGVDEKIRANKAKVEK